MHYSLALVGLGPHALDRAQFFSIRTSRPVNNVTIFLFKTEPTHQLVSSANLQLLSPP